MNTTTSLQLAIQPCAEQVINSAVYRRERNLFAYIFKSFSEEKVQECQSRIDDVKLATLNVFSVTTFVK